MGSFSVMRHRIFSMNWKHVLLIAVCAGSGVTLAQYSFSTVSIINLIINYFVPLLGAFVILAITSIGKKHDD